MDGRTYLTAKSSSRPAQAHDLLANLKDADQPGSLCLPVKNAKEKQALRLALEARFPQWFFLLRRVGSSVKPILWLCNRVTDLTVARRQNFSLLLCGFGSKRGLLHKFAAEVCVDGGVLVVNGAAPHLTARSLLYQVAAMAVGSHSPQHTW